MRTLYAAHLACASAGYVCVVNEKALAPNARTALRNSAERLGFGADACAYVTIEGTCDEGAEPSRLGAYDLFTLVETIDPLCIVAADAQAATILSQAYRAEVPTDAACRLFGRNAVAFRDFARLLETPDDKQKAWALLKRLA